MNNYQKINEFVSREVRYSACVLVAELTKKWDVLTMTDQGALLDLSISSRDYEEPARDAGWEEREGLDDGPTFVNHYIDGGESYADDWEDLCNEQNIDPYEREAFEHWIVTDWLGERLTEKGETVRELMGLTIWARGTTGQVIAHDSVIEELFEGTNHE